MDDSEDDDFDALGNQEEDDDVPALISNRDGRLPFEDAMEVDDDESLPDGFANDNQASAATNYRGDFDVPDVTLSTNKDTIVTRIKKMAGYSEGVIRAYEGTEHGRRLKQLFDDADCIDDDDGILGSIVEKLIDKVTYKPSKLNKKHPKVVYICFQVGTEEIRAKVGMTNDWKVRMPNLFGDKTYSFAMALANLQEIRQLIDDEDIQKILNLRFPSFRYEKSRKKLVMDDIALYIMESFMAGAIENAGGVRCFTVNVLERFMPKPTTGADVLEGIQVRLVTVIEDEETGELKEVVDDAITHKFDPEDPEKTIRVIKIFLFGHDGPIPKDLLINLLLTWSTTKSWVQRMAPERYFEEIFKKIPKGEFIKLLLLSFGLFAAHETTGYDVIEEPPGIRLLEKVVQRLVELGEDATREQIEEILSMIPPASEDGTYIRPEDSELAEAFAEACAFEEDQKLERLIEGNDQPNIHYVERHQIETLRREMPEEYTDIFASDGCSRLEIGNLATIWETYPRKDVTLKFISSWCFFLAWSPDTPMDQRINTQRALVGVAYLFSLVGFCSTSFLRAMEGYLENLEQARDMNPENPQWPRRQAIQVLPEGHLEIAVRGVQCVSNNIGAGLNVYDYMYVQLALWEKNPQLRNVLLHFLRTMGVNLDHVVNEDAPVSSFPGFICPGRLGTLLLEKEDCSFGDKKEGQRFTMICATLESGQCPWPGVICCAGCHRANTEVRQRHALEDLGDSRTAAQQLRLDQLRSRTSNEHRKRQMKKKGRAFVVNDRRVHQHNDDIPQTVARRAKARERKRQNGYQPGKQSLRDRNKSGDLDYSNHKPLPEILKAMLLVVFERYPGQMQNKDPGCIKGQPIHEFLLAVLNTVGRACGVTRPIRTEDGRLKYRKPGFDAALNEVLESAGPEIWRLKPEYRAFGTQSQDWTGMDFRPDMLDEVQRIAGDQQELNTILQAVRNYENGIRNMGSDTESESEQEEAEEAMEEEAMGQEDEMEVDEAEQEEAMEQEEAEQEEDAIEEEVGQEESESEPEDREESESEPEESDPEESEESESESSESESEESEWEDDE